MAITVFLLTIFQCCFQQDFSTVYYIISGRFELSWTETGSFAAATVKKNTSNSRRIWDVNTYKHVLSFSLLLTLLCVALSHSPYALWWMLLSPTIRCTMNMQCDPLSIPVEKLCLLSALPPPQGGQRSEVMLQLLLEAGTDSVPCLTALTAGL